MAQRWFVYGEKHGTRYRWGPYLSRGSSVTSLNRAQQYKPKQQAFVRVARGAYEYVNDASTRDGYVWFVFTRRGAEHIKGARAEVQQLLPYGHHVANSPLRKEFRAR